MPRPGLLATMRGAGDFGYLSTCEALGALTVQDGLYDALTSSAYTVRGTGSASTAGTDGYGHAAVLCAATGVSIGTNVDLSAPGSYTMVGATDLTNGNTSDFSRLVMLAGGAFLGRHTARTNVGVARHVFASDGGTWHWFAFTVDHSAAAEVSVVYRDSSVYSAAVTRDDTAAPGGSVQIDLGGSPTQANRQIGHFSACAVFPSALTADDIGDLYAAYQRGL